MIQGLENKIGEANLRRADEKSHWFIGEDFGAMDSKRGLIAVLRIMGGDPEMVWVRRVVMVTVWPESTIISQCYFP